MQTKLQSFIESAVNIFIGFLVSLVAQVAFFPFFDIRVSLSDNLMLGALFTVVSLIRSYFVRRYFNGRIFK